jgi:DNA sulfur modification protein DndD
VEATRILSEGHLRCLGLSLILAAIKRNQDNLLPVIVFDDVINAIDIEHRDNILKLLFTNDFFNKKQLIITTHDRIFWEKFCNLYDSRIGESKNISFVLFYDKFSGIYYEKYNVGYQEKIEKSLSLYDLRQSLIYLRLLFEKLVFDYCNKNNLKGEFKFNKNNGLYNKKGFIISLENMYSVCAQHLKNHKDPIFLNLFNNIKNTLTFDFLNQEHHSFQNHGYELTHGKTTTELEDTYQNIKDFEKYVLGKKVFIKKIIDLFKQKIKTNTICT